MPKVDLEKFRRDGFVIVPVLEGDELARCRAAADLVMQRPAQKARLGHHYISILHEATHDRTLQNVLFHPVLLNAVEQILGSPLIIDNAAFLAAEPGAVYHQGWHRDVLQIPESDICDELFSPKWRHNNVQLNLALADHDDAFWAVPGSHLRPDTAAERAAFGSTKHMSAPDAVMPGATAINLRAGEAAMYNNNLIHRGFSNFTRPRRTLHFGYHCAKHAPTWHFYTPIEYSEAYIATMPPQLQKMIRERSVRMKEYPDIKQSYRAGLV